MRRLAVGLGFLVLTLGAGRAMATPTIISAVRHVEIGDFGGTQVGPNSPSTALGAFTDSVTGTIGDEEGIADQNSDIQPGSGLFSGTGNASVGFSTIETDLAFASSFFDVYFDITTAYSYSLGGELTANVDGGEGLGVFRLVGPTSLSFAAIDFGTTPLGAAGVLAPGSYQLTVFASMSPGAVIDIGSAMGGSASYDFNFRIQEITNGVVPEPATLALLAFGLLGLGIARRGKGTLD